MAHGVNLATELALLQSFWSDWLNEDGERQDNDNVKMCRCIHINNKNTDTN